MLGVTCLSGRALAAGAGHPLRSAGPSLQAPCCRAPHSRCSAVAVPSRQQRRRTAVVAAAAGSLYDTLGISQGASERDIKRAYRQKALKLHPDVNKAPNAQEQFLEVKAAFAVLSDPQQRAAYDRELRGGFGSSGFGSSAGWGDFGGWGSSGAGAGSSSSSGTRARPKQPEEEFYGLGELLSEVGSWVAQQGAELAKLQQGAADALGGAAVRAGQSLRSGKLEDFFNDLEKEVSGWSRERGGSGKAPASLWEELAAIGEEFVDFLESSLPDEARRPSGAGKEGSSSGGATSFNGSSSGGSGTSSGRPKSPVDAYEDLKRRYNLFDESGAAARSSSGSSSSGGGSNNRGAAGATGSTTSSSSSSRAGGAAAKPQKTADEEIDDMLAALKKKHGRS